MVYHPHFTAWGVSSAVRLLHPWILKSGGGRSSLSQSSKESERLYKREFRALERMRQAESLFLVFPISPSC